MIEKNYDFFLITGPSSGCRYAPVRMAGSSDGWKGRDRGGKGRFVLLGASNLSFGLHRVVARAAAAVAHGDGDVPLDVLVAGGFGRSFGRRSYFLWRGLPAIRSCGLWDALAEWEPGGRGLITDVGNDILYGEEPDTILEWVTDCLDRLQERGIDPILTSYDGSLAQSASIYAGEAGLRHPLVSPIYADFGPGFPPALLSSGTRDLLLSCTVRLHRALREAGVEADLHVFDAMWHGAARMPDMQDLQREVQVFLREHLGTRPSA